MDAIERKDAFSNLHQRVVDGMKTFVEMGEALREIREKKLFKEGGYSSFKAYLSDSFAFSPQHASRLIEAAGIAETHDVPNEHVARKLADVPEEHRAEVLQVAKERMDGDVTGSMIQDVATEIIDVDVPKPANEVRPSSSDHRQILREVDHLIVSLNELRKANSFLDINVASGALKTVKAAVKQSVLTHRCPACSGRVSQCQVCRGHGWVPQEIFDARCEQYR